MNMMKMHQCALVGMLGLVTNEVILFEGLPKRDLLL